MTFPYTTPILGILNDTDAPHQNMVVVIVGKSDKPRWCYVARRMTGNAEHPYNAPDGFTRLSDFGVHASLTPDGRLALHRLTISVARYTNGNIRHWQGNDKCVLDVHPNVAGAVLNAVNLEFEARRVRA